MKISDVILEMELNDVEEADIADIVNSCEELGFFAEALDEELLRRGYDKVFTVDDKDEWEDDDLASIERFPHRKAFRD